jgi:hypothetical protein
MMFTIRGLQVLFSLSTVALGAGVVYHFYCAGGPHRRPMTSTRFSSSGVGEIVASQQPALATTTSKLTPNGYATSTSSSAAAAPADARHQRAKAMSAASTAVKNPAHLAIAPPATPADGVL